MTVGLLYDARFLEHRAPVGHPECEQRLQACVQALEGADLWSRFEPVPARRATAEQLSLGHEERYIARVLAHEGQVGQLDFDTYVSEGSVEAALLAAGGSIALAERIAAGSLERGFALVRPPGHHAEPASSGGFCLFGNAALAAATFAAAGLRPAIVDFDVHHGNGTQDIFYRRGDVLFCSMHRYGGYYPGTGAASERGAGAGEGATLNVPLSAGCDGATFLRAFEQQIVPAVERFAPDVLVVSAGYDAHARDPLGGLRVDDASFAAIAQRLVDIAGARCQGRALFVLEGGYDFQALGAGVVSATRALLGEQIAREGAA